MKKFDKMLWIGTDRTVRFVDVAQENQFDHILTLLASDGLEIVHLRPGHLVMIVDDEGAINDSPHNVLASLFYNGGQIFGNALIASILGPDVVGLAELDVEVLQTIFRNIDDVRILDPIVQK